jgi:endonuclease/exonuclease/phosphatase (EEP) superfamily protein YafD
MSTLRRRSGWTLVGLSLLLHLFTVYCFGLQPDQFAAFTVLPIWIWGGFGLLFSMVAFYFLRAPLSLIMTGVWAVTLLVGADEARVLANIGKSEPLPGARFPIDGEPVLRVITLNSAYFSFGSPAKDLAIWEPDIVLLQDVHPQHVRAIADTLYGGHGDYRAHNTSGIVTNGKIKREIRNPNPSSRNQQVTIDLPGGSSLEVVNVHLASAATDLRFWKRSTWRAHRTNRALRATELTLVEQILEQTTNFPNTATVFGGDFNAPAPDIVLRQLSSDFVDAFAAVGTGWGNTFQRRLPILRIDHIYATSSVTPISCRAVTTRHSDHRMVVADFLIR